MHNLHARLTGHAPARRSLEAVSDLKRETNPPPQRGAD